MAKTASECQQTTALSPKQEYSVSTSTNIWKCTYSTLFCQMYLETDPNNWIRCSNPFCHHKCMRRCGCFYKQPVKECITLWNWHWTPSVQDISLFLNISKSTVFEMITKRRSMGITLKYHWVIGSCSFSTVSCHRPPNFNQNSVVNASWDGFRPRCTSPSANPRMQWC